MGGIGDHHSEDITIIDSQDQPNSSILATRSSSASDPSPAETTSEPISSDPDPLALPIEQNLPGPFDNVSKALAALGALSIDDFLSNVTPSSAVFDVSFYVQLPETAIQDTEADGVAHDEDGQTKTDDQRVIRNMVAKLHEASNKVFGSSDCMKFEYMEEDPKSEWFPISRRVILNAST
jgi:hypothetical protein